MKSGGTANASHASVASPAVVEEFETEEVTNFAELITESPSQSLEVSQSERPLSQLSKEELFDKLQNYKKLLDNGLILQGEYDRLKNEIIGLL